MGILDKIRLNLNLSKSPHEIIINYKDYLIRLFVLKNSSTYFNCHFHLRFKYILFGCKNILHTSSIHNQLNTLFGD